MNPDQMLRMLINTAVRGAVYKLIWRSPMGVSVAIVLIALAYALFGHR